MSDIIRILVGDKLSDKGLEYLRNFDGVKVDVKTGLSEDEIAGIIGQYDGLIVRSGVQVTAKVLDKPGKLRAIARAGVGVDNIDLQAATQKGVLVMNSAEASTITTAEHAFALMIALSRNIGPAFLTMRNGGWDRSRFVGTQLSGKTLGIVGFGRIGRTVAERGLAFGMNVLAFDPVFNAKTALDGRAKMFSNFVEMLPDCDYLSFHVPLNDSTRGMLNRETFAKCKTGVRVVNAARGGVIDIPSLIEACDSDQCGGAGIDVYEAEPPAEDDPLRHHDKILVTPHLGASTAEAQEAVSNDACAQLLEYLRGEGIRGAVNLGRVRLDLDETQERFADLARRMARLVAPICEQGIQDVNVKVNGHAIASAAGTLERMVVIELLRTMLDDPVNMVNVEVIAEQRGITHATTVMDKKHRTPRITIDVKSGEKRRHIVGSVFADNMPRILEIDGYRMDMIPKSTMLLVKNVDRPGMVGQIGTRLGNEGINIADMALSRREDSALMVLRVDALPTAEQLERLRECEGFLKVAAVDLLPID